MTEWVRSSHCAGNGDCIEVTTTASGKVTLRHRSKAHVIYMVLTRAEWDAFTAGIKAGDFDQLGDMP